VLAFVGVLRALNQAIRDLDRSVIARGGEHPDSKIFASLPRSGQINAAQLLACWGDCRDAHDGPQAVAARAGIVPVTRQSGKHAAVSFRWACNKRFSQRHDDLRAQLPTGQPWAAKVDADAIARGHDHPTPPASLLAPGPGGLALLGRPGALRPSQAPSRPTARREASRYRRSLTYRVSRAPARS
jgi:Transposase IS116/IS110/IS902 family